MTTARDTERLVSCTRTHWMKYMFNALKNHLLVFVGITLLWVASIAALQPVSVITCFLGIMLIVYSHHNFFHKLLSESMYDIFVTTERVIYFDDSLYMNNDEHEIPLHRVAGIEAKQKGLLQNVLNYGTLWIDTGGGTLDLKRCIPHVPNPETLCESIARLVHTGDSLPQHVGSS